MKWLGLLAIGCYAVHWGYHLWHGHPANGLWACHLAALVVGIGLLLGSPATLAVGVLWLAIGVPLWIVDVATGGEFTPTSLLTHVGGSIVGIIGLWQLGMPEQAWWKALLALAILQQVCRWITPPKENVNVAFTVYRGMKRWFPSYRWYCLALGLAVGLYFFAAEYGLRQVVNP